MAHVGVALDLGMHFARVLEVSFPWIFFWFSDHLRAFSMHSSGKSELLEVWKARLIMVLSEYPRQIWSQQAPPIFKWSRSVSFQKACGKSGQVNTFIPDWWLQFCIDVPGLAVIYRRPLMCCNSFYSRVASTRLPLHSSWSYSLLVY